jgi:ABC-2 type transport system ATP-binding protein
MDFPEDMGIIIETPGFLPNFSGAKNLQILASLKRKIGSDMIRDTIRRVGLDPNMKKPVGKYSLGMRQRLGIARPSWRIRLTLFLMSRFNGHDKIGVRDMRTLIK